MSWLDNYRTASYRGVEFRVESHDSKFGRRQVTHEYPQRDKPFTEDLGRKAREFTVEAYLVGDDYAASRDRLIAACESSGGGELVHPYLGNMTVECTGLTLRESSADGRMCRMQLSFVEAGEASYPTTEADPVRSITAAANDAMEASATGFTDRFTVQGFASFVIDSASGKLTGFSNMLGGLTANPTASTQQVAEFFDRVNELKSNALTLVRQPAVLAAKVLGVISSVRDVFGTGGGSVLRSIRAAYSVPEKVPTNTSNRKQQAENSAAFDMLVRQAALAELAKDAGIRADDSAASTAPGATPADGLYQSRDEAIAERDEIIDAIDVEAEDPGTDALAYQALSKLRAEVVNGVPSKSLRLPSIVELANRATLPSLVVSYQFYGDASRAVEIASRNKIPHPGFVPGGRTLEVIADAE